MKALAQNFSVYNVRLNGELVNGMGFQVNGITQYFLYNFNNSWGLFKSGASLSLILQEDNPQNCFRLFKKKELLELRHDGQPVFIENETILKPGMILGVREWKEKYKVLGLFCGGNVLLKEENHLLCGYAPNELKTLENLRAASTFNWYIIE